MPGDPLLGRPWPFGPVPQSRGGRGGAEPGTGPFCVDSVVMRRSFGIPAPSLLLFLSLRNAAGDRGGVRAWSWMCWCIWAAGAWTSPARGRELILGVLAIGSRRRYGAKVGGLECSKVAAVEVALQDGSKTYPYSKVISFLQSQADHHNGLG